MQTCSFLIIYFSFPRSGGVHVVMNKGLTELKLRSLKEINNGAIEVQGNKELCLADTVPWASIIPEGTIRLSHNKNAKECSKSANMFWCI